MSLFLYHNKECHLVVVLRLNLWEPVNICLLEICLHNEVDLVVVEEELVDTKEE